MTTSSQIIKRIFSRPRWWARSTPASAGPRSSYAPRQRARAGADAQGKRDQQPDMTALGGGTHAEMRRVGRSKSA
ncbi:hypothetical protein [Paracidovorax citrulli]|uniref:hypothetical protein n=1 Tax=Paracidovorax citrulli TaxID=80869 RepID=UPI001E6099D0|nr:hypothetical protein [Paracidovorax citrulli]